MLIHCKCFSADSLLQMLMNAKRGWPASALNAAARIRGVVMSAAVVMVYCTCKNMTHV
jgi:hypothetical protein